MALRGNVNNPEIGRYLRHQNIQAFNFLPLAADADYFKTSTALAANTTTLAAASMTKSYAPEWPVCPVLVITNNKASGETSWTSVAVTLTGVDQFGNTITESIAGVDSSDTWTATALNAFATLTSITFVVTGGTACDSSDAYTLGYAKTYGLGCQLEKSGDLLIHNFNGATDAGTLSTNYSTYVIAGTPDAAKIMSFYMRTSHGTRH